MGPTPESAGITAQPGFRYLRVASPIELVYFLNVFQIGGRTMSSKARFLRDSPNITQRQVKQ